MLNLENHTPSFGKGRYVRKHIGKQFYLFWLPRAIFIHLLGGFIGELRAPPAV
jgi:hypothetical protein